GHRRHQGADRAGGQGIPAGGSGAGSVEAGLRARAARARRHTAVPRRAAGAARDQGHRVRCQGAPLAAPVGLQRAGRRGRHPSLARGLRLGPRQGVRSSRGPQADRQRGRQAGGAHADQEAARAL
ncbi:MAG: hypothetical protein AVDCRST_MAG38-2084, partial [uncultured Solirubrobacteraceae bacterium]